MNWHPYFTTHGDPWVVSDPKRPAFTKICDVSTSPDDYGRSHAFLLAASPRLLAVIQGALRIESLWRPSYAASSEHEEECRALEIMHSQFVEAVKLATESS